jgi:hypothetical protein
MYRIVKTKIQFSRNLNYWSSQVINIREGYMSSNLQESMPLTEALCFRE